MKIEELREKLKYVYDIFKQLHEHPIFGGKLRPYTCPQNRDGVLEVHGLYADDEEACIDPRVIVEIIDSNIILTIENRLWLEVTDKVRLETKMSLVEVRDYLEDFFKACDNANCGMQAAILERQRHLEQEYQRGEDLLELL